MLKDYEIERLRALLEGLECQNIDWLISESTPDDLRFIGEEIAKVAKEAMHYDAPSIPAPTL